MSITLCLDITLGVCTALNCPSDLMVLMFYHGDAVIDETGTVGGLETEIDPEEVQELRTQERLTAKELQEVDSSLLRVHGVAAGKKQEGICRLVYENANGFNTKLTYNVKIDQAKTIINNLEADIVAYNEIRVNWKHKSNVNSLGNLFQGGGLEVRAVAAHNAHKDGVEKTQEGIS